MCQVWMHAPGLHLWLLEHLFCFPKTTISLLLEIRAVLVLVDSSVLCHCLLRSGLPEEYISAPNELCRRAPGQVRAYSQLSPPLVISSGAKQGYPISPLFFALVERFAESITISVIGSQRTESSAYGMLMTPSCWATIHWQFDLSRID